MALSQKQLNATGCSKPNCDHDHTVLFLHSVCHPNAGTRARYNKLTGLLTIVCKRCDMLVAEVKVAEQ